MNSVKLKGSFSDALLRLNSETYSYISGPRLALVTSPLDAKTYLAPNYDPTVIPCVMFCNFGEGYKLFLALLGAVIGVYARTICEAKYRNSSYQLIRKHPSLTTNKSKAYVHSQQ